MPRQSQETACNFLNSIDDVVKIVWVHEELHSVGEKMYLKGKTSVGFVDCISFISMRHYGINIFLGFDKHFTEHGFKQF